MAKFQKLRKDLQENQEEIKQLQSFRSTKQVRHLLRHLFGEQSFLRREIQRLQKTKESTEKDHHQRIQRANINRSEKMKRNWRYFKAILENYDINMSPKELRTAFRQFKQGLQTDVSEIIWRNPSP